MAVLNKELQLRVDVRRDHHQRTLVLHTRKRVEAVGSLENDADTCFHVMKNIFGTFVWYLVSLRCLDCMEGTSDFPADFQVLQSALTVQYLYEHEEQFYRAG